MGTNCLGPFLLTQLLLPALTQTAQTLPAASVRVVFIKSSIVGMNGPPGGPSLAELEPGKHSKDKARNYSSSKAGNWPVAFRFDGGVRKGGIVVTQRPGNLRTKS